MGDVLRENPIVATRQHGDGTSAEPLQLREAVGISQDIDRLELDRTDREKLFEFQTTRSTRLPERFQLYDVSHGTLHIQLPDYGRCGPRSSTAHSAASFFAVMSESPCAAT